MGEKFGRPAKPYDEVEAEIVSRQPTPAIASKRVLLVLVVICQDTCL